MKTKDEEFAAALESKPGDDRCDAILLLLSDLHTEEKAFLACELLDRVCDEFKCRGLCVQTEIVRCFLVKIATVFSDIFHPHSKAEP